MKRLALPLFAALALSACATPAFVSPVEVTRFVGAQPAYLGQGTIEIAAAPGMAEAGMGADSLRFSVYADAVRRELEQLGYRVVAQGGAQVAQVSVEEGVSVEGRRRGSGVGVGAGASTGGYRSGVGVGVGVDVGSLLSGPPPERIDRTVSVAIRQDGAAQNLWEGRASMTATSNSDYADDDSAAARIADALFADFPGTSGETVEID
ncbi:MAG: DUF4136 domain-containing protein [Alteraurantiacibacter sp.]